MPKTKQPVPEDLINAIKAFGAISARSGQKELANIFGVVSNAVEQGELEDLELHISTYAARNGLDKPLDFSNLKGVG